MRLKMVCSKSSNNRRISVKVILPRMTQRTEDIKRKSVKTQYFDNVDTDENEKRQGIKVVEKLRRPKSGRNL